MSSPAQPVKRRPGRPRKMPVPEVETPKPATDLEVGEPELPAEPDPAAKPLAEPAPPAPESSKPKFPADERIGEEADPAWTSISFSDDRQYRIEDGVIVERVR